MPPHDSDLHILYALSLCSCRWPLEPAQRKVIAELAQRGLFSPALNKVDELLASVTKLRERHSADPFALLAQVSVSEPHPLFEAACTLAFSTGALELEQSMMLEQLGSWLGIDEDEIEDLIDQYTLEDLSIPEYSLRRVQEPELESDHIWAVDFTGNNWGPEYDLVEALVHLARISAGLFTPKEIELTKDDQGYTLCFEYQGRSIEIDNLIETPGQFDLQLIPSLNQALPELAFCVALDDDLHYFFVVDASDRSALEDIGLEFYGPSDFEDFREWATHQGGN